MKFASFIHAVCHTGIGEPDRRPDQLLAATRRHEKTATGSEAGHQLFQPFIFLPQQFLFVASSYSVF
jgi:hypothetical protein